MLAASCCTSSPSWKQLANHHLFVVFPVPDLVLGRAEHQTDAMSLEQLGKVCSLNADLVSSTVNQCPARGGTCGSSGWACGLSLPQGQ